MVKKWLLVILVSFIKIKADVPEINIVGFIKFANGLGRVTTTWIDALSPHVRVNFIDTRPTFSSSEDVPSSVRAIVDGRKKTISKKVSLLTDNLWVPKHKHYDRVPTSSIKLAYSMCESTKAPRPWVDALNKYFDAVLVPDEFLVAVYKTSGVRIPIFVVPLALYLEDFLALPLKQAANTPFVFGISAALSRNKNVSLLIKSFAAEFGNRKDVMLKIHSPWEGNCDEVRALIRKLKLKNVSLSIGKLSWKEYVAFMRGIDCYCLLSLGEGFSITVREAMAIGTPCVISNNTAHTTICNTGLVYGVPALLRQKSEGEFYHVDVGYNFNCRLDDVRQALRHVYQQYPLHLARAQERRTWASHYLIKNCVPIYSNFAQPKQLRYGTQHSVDESGITTSGALYEKYQALLSKK